MDFHSKHYCYNHLFFRLLKCYYSVTYLISWFSNLIENQYIIRIKPLIVLIMIPKEKEFKLIKIYMYICGCLRVFTQVLLPEVQ